MSQNSWGPCMHASKMNTNWKCNFVFVDFLSAAVHEQPIFATSGERTWTSHKLKKLRVTESSYCEISMQIDSILLQHKMQGTKRSKDMVTNPAITMSQ